METIGILEQVFGDNVGHVYRLDLPVMVVGRSAESDIQLLQESVSRRHAEVVRSNGAYLLRDKQSMNGTHVNDAQVSERELAQGDFLKIGRTILRFCLVPATNDGSTGSPGGSPPPSSAASAASDRAGGPSSPFLAPRR
jgi:pSer/pThr/pTyr-binding forkhead associated (FHA) protein